MAEIKLFLKRSTLLGITGSIKITTVFLVDLKSENKVK